MTKATQYTLDVTYPMASPRDTIDAANGQRVEIILRPDFQQRFWVRVMQGDTMLKARGFWLLSDAIREQQDRIADIGDQMRRAA